MTEKDKEDTKAVAKDAGAELSAPAPTLEATPASEPTVAAKIVLQWLQSFNGSAIAGNTPCYNLLHEKTHELIDLLNAGVE